MPEMQTVPARHGVATFVPAGQTIKIVNTSGSQVIDTWAFALPHPDVKNGDDQQDGQQQEAPKKEELPEQKEQEKPAKPAPKKNRSKSGMDLPTQEEAEKATKEGIENGAGGQEQGQKKNTWSSYVPSLGWSGKNGSKQGEQQGEKGETEKQKNSRTWGSYMPSGKGFSNYVPKTASDTVSSFAGQHQRNPNKSYVDQLKDFSTTPVGAAGIKGLAVISGSGYGSSLFAGYQAWNAMNAPDAPPMEFMSLPHSRSSTQHMVPKVNDLFVSNLREPILTLVEDTSSGAHDTMMAACDPARYRQLGVDHWEEHGSCAENLVLALKELNERAGLKGAKGVGADVTINNVPAPLNLFMNVPWTGDGDISFKAPKTKAGEFVRLRAERDIVIVMSSCPQDVTDINNKKIQDAHFLVEGGEGDDSQKPKQAPRRRPQPRKIDSSKRAPSTVATGEMGDDDKSQVGSTPAKKPLPRKVPAKRTTQSQTGATKKPAAAAAPSQPKKKPVPKPAGTPANAKENENATNASTTPAADGKPVEKKKPRKLVRKE